MNLSSFHGLVPELILGGLFSTNQAFYNMMSSLKLDFFFSEVQRGLNSFQIQKSNNDGYANIMDISINISKVLLRNIFGKDKRVNFLQQL